MDEESENLLKSLPLEIWTESDDGQKLLDLASRGRCKYRRLNATLGRFELVSGSRGDMQGFSSGPKAG